jgi:hypothetical protein
VRRTTWSADTITTGRLGFVTLSSFLLLLLRDWFESKLLTLFLVLFFFFVTDRPEGQVSLGQYLHSSHTVIFRSKTGAKPESDLSLGWISFFSGFFSFFFQECERPKNPDASWKYGVCVWAGAGSARTSTGWLDECVTRRSSSKTDQIEMIRN